MKYFGIEGLKNGENWHTSQSCKQHRLAWLIQYSCSITVCICEQIPMVFASSFCVFFSRFLEWIQCSSNLYRYTTHCNIHTYICMIDGMRKCRKCICEPLSCLKWKFSRGDVRWSLRLLHSNVPALLFIFFGLLPY